MFVNKYSSPLSNAKIKWNGIKWKIAVKEKAWEVGFTRCLQYMSQSKTY